MKHKMKKKVRHYLREISSALPMDYPNKKRILNALKQNIENFLEEHPSSDWNDILYQFGTSNEVVSSYIAELSDTEISISNQKRHRNFLVSTIASFSAIMILILGIYHYYLWKQTHDFIIEETLIVYDGTEFLSESEIEDIISSEVSE